jgi:ankyrin repeat protein
MSVFADLLNCPIAGTAGSAILRPSCTQRTAGALHAIRIIIKTMSFWTEGGLTYLAQQGDLAGVRQLVERGAPVDFIENGRFNDTPLMVAARGGHVAVMQFLIDQGANVNYCDNDLFSPVTAAGGAGQWLALKLLAAQGGDFQHCDATGCCGRDYLARCRSKSMKAAIESILMKRDIVP